MDPQVQQAIKQINKANRRVLMAMGMLMLASLQATKAAQKLQREVKRHGGWKEATPEEVEDVSEELADMVAEYASQTN